jgi:hypothetical protein
VVADRAQNDAAHDARDLEGRLLGFCGVGPVTMNIFLRELRLFWAKADPDPLPTVERLAKRLSIDLGRYKRKSLLFGEADLIRRRREVTAAQVRSSQDSKTNLTWVNRHLHAAL